MINYPTVSTGKKNTPPPPYFQMELWGQFQRPWMTLPMKSLYANCNSFLHSFFKSRPFRKMINYPNVATGRQNFPLFSNRIVRTISTTLIVKVTLTMKSLYAICKPQKWIRTKGKCCFRTKGNARLLWCHYRMMISESTSLLICSKTLVYYCSAHWRGTVCN